MCITRCAKYSCHAEGDLSKALLFAEFETVLKSVILNISAFPSQWKKDHSKVMQMTMTAAQLGC